MKKMLPLLFLVLSNVAFGTVYYVGGPGALDTNPGTSSQPFATIHKAASVAVAGDVINIRAGTYRETIVPANSGTSGNPIVYQPDVGATVIISGLNEAGNSGWTVHSGSIYKKSITLPVSGYNLTMSNNTTLAANQVFKDGSMQFEARWPKINNTADLLDRSKLRGRLSTSNWQSNTLTDSGLPNIAGGWAGGKIFITGWFISQTSTITSHSGTTIGFSSQETDLRFHQYYYVTGKLGALTQAKEWHYESGTLYFWQEGGGSPTGVEYKARNWGFDLRGRSNITIKGLQFFGCDPMTGDIASVNTIIDGIKSKYQNHAVIQEGPDIIYYNAKQTGLKLIGQNSIVKNSEFQYAASQCIWLGANCTAENNLITDINYEANYGAGISLWETTGGQTIKYNTIARAGRSAIDFGGYVDPGQHLNMDISYNDVYDFGMLHADVGGMYGARNTNITGTRIHHNWIHDNKAVVTPVTSLEVGINAGLYLDQTTGPATVDHNVFWNNYQCDITAQPGSESRSSSYYNNTLATNNQPNPGHPWARSYVTFETDFWDVQKNNIYRDDLFFNWSETGGDVTFSLLHTQNPSFLNAGGGGLNYRLTAGSIAINAGTGIPGITDGSIGTPDIGAYEFGGTDWVPGYNAVTTPPPSGETITTLNDTQTGTGQNQFEYVGTGWGAGPSTGAYLNDEHYSATTNDYYQVDFTGTEIEVYSQKFSSSGIAAYSIDGGTETMVDHYNSTLMLNTLVYTSPTLSNGSHTLKVRVTGTKHASSSSYWLVADRVAITTPLPPVATPTFSPVAGTYSSAQSVTISTTTSGASIRYTTDGSTPTASSTLYTAPVSVSVSTTLKAIGIKSGMSNSEVATAAYTIQSTTTTINNTVTGTGQNQFEYVGTGWGSGPSTGAYLNDEHYTATTNNYYQVDFTGTKIEVYSQKFSSSGIAAYSIDGGAETNVDHYNATLLLNTLVYTSPTLTQGSHTLKVRVTGTKHASSSSYWLVADRVVITTPPPSVATPTFSPVAGTYTTTQSVTISTTTSGASIKYTTDGSTPTASSTLYTAPVSVSASTTLKAIGIKSGLTDSEITTAAYIIQVLTTINNTVTGTGQNQFEYVGAGWGSGPSTGAYLNDEHYTATTNSYYQVDFTGTKIEVYSQKFSSSGIAAYSIDGGAETNVDHYNPTLLLNTLVYTSPTLTQGSHTLKVRVTGTKNASSSSYWLVADRVVITSEGSGGMRVSMNPNEDKKNSPGIDSTSMVKDSRVEEKQNLESLVYPNPGKGNFYLNSSHEIKAIQIYSVGDGKTHAIKTPGMEHISEVDISAFSDGVYLLKLFDGERYYFVRLIKQN